MQIYIWTRLHFYLAYNLHHSNVATKQTEVDSKVVGEILEKMNEFQALKDSQNS